MLRKPHIVIPKGRGVVLEAPCAHASGTTPTIADGGGKILDDVRVNLLCWGAYWTSEPNGALFQFGQICDGLRHLIEYSPYMAGLSQYRGVKQGRMGVANINNSTPVPNPFSDTDITNLLTSELNRVGGQRTLPTPDETIQRYGGNSVLYFVIPPDGIPCTQPDPAKNRNGSHSFFDLDSMRIYYGWALHNGIQNDPNGAIAILSHELVEACTDPEGTGFQMNAPGICTSDPHAWCEIGDVCNTNGTTLNGLNVRSYWSDTSKACVIPS
jgi:hypothetical protein